MARRYWPGESPLGARIVHTGTFTVVGVIGDVLHESLHAEAQPTFYVPAAQTIETRPITRFSFVMRHIGDPQTLIPPIRETVWSVDPGVPVTQVTSVSSLLAKSASNERFRTLLMAVFGVSAALLAGAGLYGVTARSVARRTRELGIKMALGATGRGLVGSTVRTGARTAALGIVLGLLASFIAARLLSGFLFGVEASDPLTYVCVAALVVVVCLAASYVPARRITKLDPAEVLRAE